MIKYDDYISGLTFSQLREYLEVTYEVSQKFIGVVLSVDKESPVNLDEMYDGIMLEVTGDVGVDPEQIIILISLIVQNKVYPNIDRNIALFMQNNSMQAIYGRHGPYILKAFSEQVCKHTTENCLYNDSQWYIDIYQRKQALIHNMIRFAGDAIRLINHESLWTPHSEVLLDSNWEIQNRKDKRSSHGALTKVIGTSALGHLCKFWGFRKVFEKEHITVGESNLNHKSALVFLEKLKEFYISQA